MFTFSDDLGRRNVLYTLFDTTLSIDAAFNEHPISLQVVDILKSDLSNLPQEKLSIFMEVMLKVIKQLPNTQLIMSALKGTFPHFCQIGLKWAT